MRRFPLLGLKPFTRQQRRSLFIPGLNVEQYPFGDREDHMPPLAEGKLTSSETPFSTPSFHELSSSGYNGRLASAFLSTHNRMERLLEIMRQMRANGERPAGLITYNYMFSALLEAGQRSEAFSLLKEMEARSITPDIFTFEIFMKSLCDNRALAMTVEELFQLMKVRYKLEPSPACWEARLCAWLSPQQEGRVIQLLGEMREEGKARYCAALYGHLLVCAVRCGAWNVASHILALVVPRAPGVPADQFNVVLPAKLYEHLLTTRGSRMSVSGVPVLRTALAQLDRAHGSVGEGAYVHILYFASSIGSALADMAFHVLSKLSMMYSAQGVHALPRPYLEAYVECVNGQTDEKYLRHPYYLQAKLEPRHIELSRKIETLLKDHGIKQ